QGGRGKTKRIVFWMYSLFSSIPILLCFCFFVFGFWVAQADLVVQVMTLAMPQDIHPLKSGTRSMGW
ncbi:MAG: hypothetical protein ACOYOZ_16830, partial [Pirellula sp.]